MKNKERLRLTMLTQRKNLEQMLDRISKATEDVSTYDHSILDAMYERIEDAMLSVESAERLIEKLD